MVWSSVKQNLLEQQQKVNTLDAMMCARLKRTVKVEIELRDWARRDDKADSKQLLKWAVMLGVPEGDQL